MALLMVDYSSTHPRGKMYIAGWGWIPWRHQLSIKIKEHVTELHDQFSQLKNDFQWNRKKYWATSNYFVSKLILIVRKTSYLVEVSQRLIILNQHLRELKPLLGIYTHNVPEQKYVVRCIANFFSIQNNFLKLTSFCKALDHLQSAKI